MTVERGGPQVGPRVQNLVLAAKLLQGGQLTRNLAAMVVRQRTLHRLVPIDLHI